MKLVQNHLFKVSIRDKDGKGLPFAKVGVFKNGNTDPISLNTTDINGFIIITNEFMSVADGDSLKFVVLS